MPLFCLIDKRFPKFCFFFFRLCHITALVFSLKKSIFACAHTMIGHNLYSFTEIQIFRKLFYRTEMFFSVIQCKLLLEWFLQ